MSLSTDSFSDCGGGECDCHGMRPASETGVWDVQKHHTVQGTAAYNKEQAQQNVSDSKVGKDWFRHTTIHPSPLLAKYMFSLTWVSLFKQQDIVNNCTSTLTAGSYVCFLRVGESPF